MEFKTLYNIKELTFKFNSYAIESYMGYRRKDGYDWRIITGSNVYCGFAYMGQNTNTLSAGYLNIVFFHNAANDLAHVGGYKNTFLLSTPEVKTVFGRDSVYVSVIQRANSRHDTTNYLVGGSGNYCDTYFEQALIKDFYVPPFVPRIFPTELNVSTITLTEGFSITAVPNDNGLYFPLFVDKNIDPVNGITLNGIIPQYIDTDDVTYPTLFIAKNFQKNIITEIFENLAVYINPLISTDKAFKPVEIDSINVATEIVKNLSALTGELNSYFPCF